MPSTMLSLLRMTGMAFKLQAGVSSAMTQTKLGGLGLDSTRFTT